MDSSSAKDIGKEARTQLRAKNLFQCRNVKYQLLLLPLNVVGVNHLVPRQEVVQQRTDAELLRGAQFDWDRSTSAESWQPPKNCFDFSSCLVQWSVTEQSWSKCCSWKKEFCAIYLENPSHTGARFISHLNLCNFESFDLLRERTRDTWTLSKVFCWSVKPKQKSVQLDDVRQILLFLNTSGTCLLWHFIHPSGLTILFNYIFLVQVDLLYLCFMQKTF